MYSLNVFAETMCKPRSVDPIYQKYIDLLDDDGFGQMLSSNTLETIKFFKSIDYDLHNFRYASNKWTIKEVLMHLIDTERGFSYRATVCIRKDDKTPLHSMDEIHYGENVDVSTRSMMDLIEEFNSVRLAFSYIFKEAKQEHLNFVGNGIGYKICARDLAFIAIGHAKHHINVVKERYL